VLLLDSDGNRIVARYYEPPLAQHAESQGQVVPLAPGLEPLVGKNPYPTVKEQRALEREVWEKARRATGTLCRRRARGARRAARAEAELTCAGDVLQYANNLVLFKTTYDVYLFVIAPDRENELMLSCFLQSLYDALEILLQNQVDKHTIQENLDLVTLALDECVDDGIILETDSSAIAQRVTRPRPDAIDVNINEQSTWIWAMGTVGLTAQRS